MGATDHLAYPGDGEGPLRQIILSAYEIDRCAVSNDDFAAFVDATGYRTESEVLGWSFVFARTSARTTSRPPAPPPTLPGGGKSRARPGAIPKVHRPASPTALTILSSTSVGTTPSHTPVGPARRSPLRPNGSEPPAADLSPSPTPGATNSPPAESTV